MSEDIRKQGTMIEQWHGDPVFWTPSRCSGGAYRIFHRDRPGRIIAEFYGDNAGTMAERFCELFGELDGSRLEEVPDAD